MYPFYFSILLFILFSFRVGNTVVGKGLEYFHAEDLVHIHAPYIPFCFLRLFTTILGVECSEHNRCGSFMCRGFGAKTTKNTLFSSVPFGFYFIYFHSFLLLFWGGDVVVGKGLEDIHAEDSYIHTFSLVPFGYF